MEDLNGGESKSEEHGADSEKVRSKDTPQDDPIDDDEQPPKQKRGMKPRSKRNRKRPRSERHALEEEISHTTHILPLELDGNPIHASAPKKMWIRALEPYPYTFSTFAKARWLGRTVLDIYSTEFGSYPKSYYESAISQGRILVSDQVVPLDHTIQGGDVLTHTVHRHEPGVAVGLKEPPYLRILEETDDVVVVDKPGTLPIHPCGGYHVQSLMNMLEPKFGKLYTIHRLDRLTSGLVILGKTSSVATDWGKAIMNRHCEKVYVARVVGKFPLNCPNGVNRFHEKHLIPNHGEFEMQSSSGDPIVSARKRNAYGYWVTDGADDFQSDSSQLQDIFDSQHSDDEWLDSTGTSTAGRKNMLWFHLACPTRIAQPKDGICEAGAFSDLDETLYLKTVKPCETCFGVVRYDEESDSTLVICRPKTGRTHQIRLHLQHLGHPIANDPNYGGEIWYGNTEGQKACRVAQARLDAIASTNQPRNEDCHDGPSTATIDVPATEDEIQQGVSTAIRQDKEDIHDFIRRTCVWCARSRNTIGITPRDVLEFLVRSPGIWLHALQYTFENDSNGGALHQFRCPLPEWAKPVQDNTNEED
jgi:23S rRNA-/tRNA-specific pseudouridylate synthase